MPPTKTQKSPEQRELEKKRARRVEDVIAASRLLRHARDGKASETRRLARDHDVAVDDLEDVERELRMLADRGVVITSLRSADVEERERAEGLAVAMEPTT